MRTMKFINPETGHIGNVKLDPVRYVHGKKKIGDLFPRKATLAMASQGYVPKNSLTKAQLKAIGS